MELQTLHTLPFLFLSHSHTPSQRISELLVPLGYNPLTISNSILIACPLLALFLSPLSLIHRVGLHSAGVHWSGGVTFRVLTVRLYVGMNIELALSRGLTISGNICRCKSNTWGVWMRNKSDEKNVGVFSVSLCIHHLKLHSFSPFLCVEKQSIKNPVSPFKVKCLTLKLISVNEHHLQAHQENTCWV